MLQPRLRPSEYLPAKEHDHTNIRTVKTCTPEHVWKKSTTCHKLSDTRSTLQHFWKKVKEEDKQSPSVLHFLPCALTASRFLAEASPKPVAEAATVDVDTIGLTAWRQQRGPLAVPSAMQIQNWTMQCWEKQDRYMYEEDTSNRHWHSHWAISLTSSNKNSAFTNFETRKPDKTYA